MLVVNEFCVCLFSPQGEDNVGPRHKWVAAATPGEEDKNKAPSEKLGEKNKKTKARRQLFTPGNPVRTLATWFDEDTFIVADKDQKWSEIHFRKEKTKWVHGTVTYAMLTDETFNGYYKVKYSVDDTPFYINQTHVHKPRLDGEEGDDSSESEHSDTLRDGAGALTTLRHAPPVDDDGGRPTAESSTVERLLLQLQDLESTVPPAKTKKVDKNKWRREVKRVRALIQTTRKADHFKAASAHSLQPPYELRKRTVTKDVYKDGDDNEDENGSDYKDGDDNEDEHSSDDDTGDRCVVLLHVKTYSLATHTQHAFPTCIYNAHYQHLLKKKLVFKHGTWAPSCEEAEDPCMHSHRRRQQLDRRGRRRAADGEEGEEGEEEWWEEEDKKEGSDSHLGGTRTEEKEEEENINPGLEARPAPRPGP